MTSVSNRVVPRSLRDKNGGWPAGPPPSEFPAAAYSSAAPLSHREARFSSAVAIPEFAEVYGPHTNQQADGWAMSPTRIAAASRSKMLVTASLGEEPIPLALGPLLGALGRLKRESGSTLQLINEVDTIVTIAAEPGLGYYVSYLDSEAEWLAYEGDLTGATVETTFTGSCDPIPRALLVPETTAQQAVIAFAEVGRRSEAVNWISCSDLLKVGF